MELDRFLFYPIEKYKVKYVLWELFLGDYLKRNQMTAIAFLMVRTTTRAAISEVLYDNVPLAYDDFYSRVKEIVTRNLLEDSLPKKLESAKEYFDILKERGVIDEATANEYLETIEEYKIEDIQSRPSPKSFKWNLERYIEHGLVQEQDEKYGLTKLGSEAVQTMIKILEEVEKKYPADKS